MIIEPIWSMVIPVSVEMLVRIVAGVQHHVADEDVDRVELSRRATLSDAGDDHHDCVMYSGSRS
jgi:hypothetical protein